MRCVVHRYDVGCSNFHLTADTQTSAYNKYNFTYGGIDKIPMEILLKNYNLEK